MMMMMIQVVCPWLFNWW